MSQFLMTWKQTTDCALTEKIKYKQNKEKLDKK